MLFGSHAAFIVRAMKSLESTLAHRLGVSVHVSPLRYRVEALQQRYPAPHAGCLEDWLLAVANARGVRIVVSAYRDRDPSVTGNDFRPPSEKELSNAALVVAICQLRNRDRPQLLRLAAQMISRQALDLRELLRVGEQERAERILAELARQALRVDSRHGAWLAIRRRFGARPGFRSPILHWTRLADPMFQMGRGRPTGWRLVS